MRLKRFICLVVQSLSGLLFTSFAAAHTSNVTEEVNVEGRQLSLIGEARSASEGIVGQADLALRPMLRPGDVLEAVPGMLVTQHSGSGKSNQMFLRGFNLDHGTDFATWVNGMPVNMRTHGHGQGYTDINFLIPETIQTLSFVKGPYHTELGDFSSAGGVKILTRDQFDKTRFKVGLGENGFQRLLSTASVESQQGVLSGALEVQRYDGPWLSVDEGVRKYNGLVAFHSTSASSQWSVTAMAYDNEWNSADQIPQRAVDSGLITERGSLDESLGGRSRRLSLSSQLHHDFEHSSISVNAYLIDYELQLFSNFSYFLENPTAGDQFEQFDERSIFGATTEYKWHNGAHGQFRHLLGADLRHDNIRQVGLYQTNQRVRVNTTREDSVDETSLGVFYELQWQLSDSLRTIVGLRGDVYDSRVDAGNPMNGGDDSDSIVSPKLSFIYSISRRSEAYLSMGRGFHSNDARGTTISVDPSNSMAVQPVDALVSSQGAEFGFKTTWASGWQSSVALWSLKLDSELLFVGDAGTTEASRPSKRHGIEFNNHWKINETWTIEADFSWTDSEFDDDIAEGKEIPGAIPFIASASISAELPEAWFGSFRIRHFSSYPLIEDDSVESSGSTSASVALGWRKHSWSVQLDVLNLFDSNDHDIDYFYTSRLAGEPLGGIEDTHFKVFEPRQLRLYLEYSF